MTALTQLQAMTTIVADTGDINQIRKFQPVDATTNPSLLLQAAEKPEYRHILESAATEAKKFSGTQEDVLSHFCDLVFVRFGVEILKYIPGRISTEVDPALSFDTDKTVQRALSLVRLYEQLKVPRERILIKIAATWEGIRAAEILEMEGIHCNMTLIFSLIQAIASAEVKATLISPFVGRILDWHKKATGKASFAPEEDPGVLSVKSIYTYLKKFDYKTVVMGASFRNKEEIIALAGCDLLTCSPQLLDELSKLEQPVARALSMEEAKKASMERIIFDEAHFRFLLNEDACATEKLSEGIRNFYKDHQKLKSQLASYL